MFLDAGQLVEQLRLSSLEYQIYGLNANKRAIQVITGQGNYTG